MFPLVPIFLGIIFVTRSNSIGIDDKLDFGNLQSHPSVYRSVHRPVSYKSAVTKIGISDNLDEGRVTCGSGGCNKTDGGTFKTDVVVHIETKLDQIQNVTQLVGDTPDVPIVIGFDSRKDETGEEKSRHIPQSIYVPSHEPYGSVGVSPFADSSSNQLFSPTLGDSRIDLGTPHDDMVNIKIKTLPPVAISVADQNSFMDFKNLAGMELTVPYFEPSQHTHHFGELPPPQHAWYNKKANSFNPVEFKATKQAWKPSVWYKTVAPLNPTTCVCQNRQDHQHGLSWYPSATGRVSSDGGKSGDPGSQINDKLAPLN